MNKEVCKKTGTYAVVHYGADEKHDVPMFLKKDGYFTENLHNAYLSTCRDDVEVLACKTNKELADEEHSLAGHVFPAHLWACDPDWQPVQLEKRNNVEGLSFFWFTFGLGHPLARMAQGVYATDEEKARETMIAFYARNWCSCYPAPDPQSESAAGFVRLGGYAYRPITRLLKEGDCY